MASLPQARHGVEAASLASTSAMSELPEVAVGALQKAGIGDCRFWARIVEGEDDAEGVLLDTVLGLCGPLDFEFDDGNLLLWDTLVPELMGLVETAKGPARRSEKRMSEVNDIQIALDHALRERGRREEKETLDQVRLAVYDPPSAGREWQPKKYRRGTTGDGPDEREKAEDTERERWAREVLNLIREARLPFLQTTGATTGTSVEQRCCLGLRARTLAKRVRDWRPFRRYLLGQHLSPFPIMVESVLAFFEVRENEGVAQNFYADFKAALKFMELAGERSPFGVPFSRIGGGIGADENFGSWQAATKAAIFRVSQCLDNR